MMVVEVLYSRVADTSKREFSEKPSRHVSFLIRSLLMRLHRRQFIDGSTIPLFSGGTRSCEHTEVLGSARDADGLLLELVEIDSPTGCAQSMRKRILWPAISTATL